MSGCLSPLLQLKARLTIAEVGYRLSLWHDSGGRFSRNRKSPFRYSRRASFSVYADGKRWKDFATGEGGDVVDFVAKALNYTASESAKWLLREYSSAVNAAFPATPNQFSSVDERQAMPDRVWVPPKFQSLSDFAAQRLIASRHFPSSACNGLRYLAELGFLRISRYWGRECWVIFDPQTRICQFRRLDGQSFIHKDGHRSKAHNLRGSCNSWAGLKQLDHADHWLIMEGAPDWLAVTGALLQSKPPESYRKYAFLCAMSASVKLNWTSTKTPQSIRIFAHADQQNTGLNAAQNWAISLNKCYPSCPIHIHLPETEKDWADVYAKNKNIDILSPL